MLSNKEIVCPDNLLNVAKKKKDVTAGIVNAGRPLPMLSALEAVKENLITPIFIGDKDEIQKSAEQLEWNISKYEIINEPVENNTAKVAAKLAADEKIRIIVKGHIHTDVLMKEVLKREYNLLGKKRLSHIWHMTIDKTSSPLIITDGALNVLPNIKTKMHILKNVVDFANRIGIEKPKVSVLSATEEVLESMPSSIEAKEITKLAKEENINADVFGPLAFDNSISKKSAAIKGIKNAVAGQADVLLVPGVETGNGLVKMMIYFMGAFDSGSFASMNVAEMGMNPAMMAGALEALPVGAATAALETLAADPGAMGELGATMTGAIAATMASKGMGEEMLGAMGASMGMEGMAGMTEGMQGLEGMAKLGEAMGGMETMAASLSTAFGDPTSGITAAMSGTVGMISGAISGKAPKEKTAVAMGMEAKDSAAALMNEEGKAPEALEMPENVSESGMMMGAMVMAKPSLAGGLPGAMAPPEGMTAMGMEAAGAFGADAGSGMAGMTDVMGGMSAGDMGEAMAGMTGMDAGAMDSLGMAEMAAQTGLTPGMVASMGAAGMAGMDLTSVMSTEVAGLGSKAIQGMAAMAADGAMGAGMMGDMMEVGLVNQGTMAAMGEKGMEGLSGAMGMEGGDMGLAAMSGGMVGMGKMDMNAQMNPEMAMAMGVGGPEGAKLGDIMGGGSMGEDPGAMEMEEMQGMEAGMESGMNLGQVSAAMGTGIDPGAAMGSVAKAAGAASEAGSGLAGAAMGSAMSAQGAAASAMGAGAMGAAMGAGGMGDGAMGQAMGGAMEEGMGGAMGGAMAGAMAGGAGGGMGMGGDMGGAMGGMEGGAMGGAMGGMEGGMMGGAMGGMGEALGGALGGGEHGGGAMGEAMGGQGGGEGGGQGGGERKGDPPPQ